MPVARAWVSSSPAAEQQQEGEAAIDDRVPHADLAADPALAKWLDHATEVAAVVSEEKAEALGARGAQVFPSAARGSTEGEWTGGGGEGAAKARKAAPARRFHVATAEAPLWQNLVEEASAGVLKSAFAPSASAVTAALAAAREVREATAPPKKHTALLVTGVAVVLGLGAYFYGQQIADAMKKLGDRVG